MKKTIGILFAFAMILSLAFIGGTSSSAQAQQGTVRRKNNRSVVGGTRYVAHKTKRGAKYAAHKTVRGAVYTTKKTVQGTRYVSHKTKVGTKYVGRKTVKGTKSIFSKTKKVVTGDN